MSCKYNYIEQSDLSNEQKEIYTNITNDIWKELSDSKLFTRVKIEGITKLAMPKTNYGQALSRIATINATREAQLVRVVKDSANPDYEIVKVNTSPLFSSGSLTSQLVIKPGVEELFKSNPELTGIGTQEQYSQYIESIFPNSKMKDIVYHGSLNKIESFDKAKLGQLTQAASAKEAFFFTNNLLVAESYAIPKNLEETEKGRELLKEFDTSNLDPGHEEDAMFIEMYNDQIMSYRDDFDFDAVPYKKGPNKIIGWKTGTKYEYYSEVYYSILNLITPKVKDFENNQYRDESYYDLIINAKKENNDGTILQNTYDGRDRWNANLADIYTVFEPDQIHILGSKQDIEGFKKWKQNPTSGVNNQHSLVDTKVEEKYFSTGKTQPVKLIIEQVAQSDHPMAVVAKELLKYNIEDGRTITLEVTDNVGPAGNSWAGVYNHGSRNIRLAQFANVKSARFEQVIVHEYIHLLTADALENKEYSKDFNNLFTKIKDSLSPEEQKLYPYSDIHEFMVGLFTDSRLIKSLSEKPSILGKTGTILKDVFDFLLKIIGISETNTAYQDAFTLATEILANQKAEYDSLKSSPYYEDQSVIMPLDKIIWGHPGIGKTFLRETNHNIIDFDSDYKVKINKKYNLEKGFKALNEWRRTNPELFNQELRQLWKEAVQEAKNTGKVLVASDMLMLREFPNDFDKVINISANTFVQRAKQRDDYTQGETESWKSNIDQALSNINTNKVITTDKYISDLFNSPNKTFLKEVGHSIRIGNTQEVFKGRTSVDAKTLLDEISQSKHPLASLAKKLSENLNRTVPVYLRDGIIGGGRGEYYGEDDAIAINSQEVNPKGVESTILHEVIHALTFDKLYDESNKEVLERFTKLFNAAKTAYPEEYNTQNLDEFITGIFTNADFINKLKTLDAIDIKHSSLWQDILNTILSLFNINKGTSLYEQAFNIGSEIIQVKSQKDQEVKYTFKAISILQSQRGKEVFEKGNKNKWSLDKILTELAIPKEQKVLLLELGVTDRDKLALELGSKYGFSVEVNVTKEPRDLSENPDGTKYYSNLTVPGGTNYTENEISTPLITPSIKGHAQFATDKGIGWFRSDEAIAYGENTGNTISFPSIDGQEVVNIPEQTLAKSKTRRILEVQSDLFQKGRGASELVRNEDFYDKNKPLNTFLNPADFDSHEEFMEANSKFQDNNQRENATSENQFLQLLNKDSNWVTFFVKAIVQSTAKETIQEVDKNDVENMVRQLEREGKLKIDCN